MRQELPRTPPGIRTSQGDAGRPGAANGPGMKLIRLGASCPAAELGAGGPVGNCRAGAVRVPAGGKLAAAAGIKFRKEWGQVGRDPLSAQPPTDHFLAQPRRSAAKALAAQGDG